MQTKSARNRILYLDVLRIMAVFCMMMLHVCASKWYDTPVESFNWNVLNFYDSAVRFCVPVFVMISGSLFLNPEREITLSGLYRKNILRILLAFIFWSALYAIVGNLDGLAHPTADVFKEIGKEFILGRYHLWFLYMIAGLYIVTPFLRKICTDRKLAVYFCILSFIFTFLANLLLLIPSLQSGMDAIQKKLNLFLVLGYTGYYVGGFLLHSSSVSRKNRRLIYCLGAVSILFTVILTSFISIKEGKPYEGLYSYLLPTTLFTAAAVFLFFKKHAPHSVFLEKHAAMITGISKLTFGMYLVHDFLITFFTKVLGFTAVSFMPVFAVPLLTICVFICSYLVSYLFSKIPVLKDFVI